MATCTLSNINSFVDLIVWPVTCNYYFWALMFFAIFVVIVWASYKFEENKLGKGDMISSLGVGALVMIFLGVIGSLIVNSDGIPMISQQILMYILAIAIPLILIWIFDR